jgi:hypothetical protein
VRGAGDSNAENKISCQLKIITEKPGLIKIQYRETALNIQTRDCGAVKFILLKNPLNPVIGYPGRKD